MKRYLTIRSFLIILIVVAFNEGTFAQSKPPWWNADWKRRRIIRIRKMPTKGTDAIAFTFHGGGHVSKTAREVTVVDEKGDVVPSKVIWHKPEGSTTIIFRGSRKGERLIVYYDSRFTSPSRKIIWKPKISLTLETRYKPPGSVKNWEAMKRLLSKSKKIYGKGFVENIWHGMNPFGSDDNYLSIYEGYLKINRRGKYYISTASDDASFLFIDDKPVAEWPGEHTIYGGRRGQHGKTIILAQGIHKISYFHAEMTGAQYMMAAWKKPGERRVKPIPPAAFLHAGKAAEISYERQSSQNLIAYLQADQRNQVVIDNRDYTRVDFSNPLTKFPKDVYIKLDFGDGVTMALKARNLKRNKISHIYVGMKDYTATLTIEKGNLKDDFKTLVRINQATRNFTINDTYIVREYARIITKSPLKQIDKKNVLLSYFHLVETLEEPALLVPIANAFLERFGKTDIINARIMRRALANGYRITDPPRALKLYEELIGQIRDVDAILDMKLAQLDIYIHKMKDYDKALTLAQSIVKDYPITKEKVRLAQVRIGDIYKEKGNYEKAEEEYRKAQTQTYREMNMREATIKQGAYAETIESYLQQNLVKPALKQLIEWEINFPMAKLSGDLTLLYAKYFFIEGDYQRVISELNGLIKLNPNTPFLPDVEFMMAEAYTRIGKKDKAKPLYEKIAKEYTNNPLSQRAKDILRREF